MFRFLRRPLLGAGLCAAHTVGARLQLGGQHGGLLFGGGAALLGLGRAAGGILQTRSRRQPFDRIYEWQPEQVHGQVDGTAAALLCPRVVPLRPGRQ